MDAPSVFWWATGQTRKTAPLSSPVAAWTMVAKRNGGEAGGQTGNYYYRNRYYHPGQGRFMSLDPIGYGDGLNMYAYVGNDPVNRSDPSGLCGTRIEGAEAANCHPNGDILSVATASGGSTHGGHVSARAFIDRVSGGSADACDDGCTVAHEGAHTMLTYTGHLLGINPGNYASSGGGGFTPGSSGTSRQQDETGASSPQNRLGNSTFSRVLQGLGGLGQLATGIGACVGSWGVACVPGAGLAALGANNLYEAIFDEPGWVRQGSRALFGQHGDNVYSVVDIASSATSIFRRIPTRTANAIPGLIDRAAHYRLMTRYKFWEKSIVVTGNIPVLGFEMLSIGDEFSDMYDRAFGG